MWTARPAPAATTYEAFLSGLRAQEAAALDALGAAAGGLSMCALSRAGTSVPAAKYDEGSVSALSEVRRALQRAGDGPDRATVMGVLLAIRAGWLTQVGTAGRTGPVWTAYLTGGLDALSQLELLVGDEGGPHPLTSN